MITTGTALILLFTIGLIGIGLGYVLRFLQMTVAKARLEVNVRKTINKAKAQAADIVAEAYNESADIRRELDERLQEVTRLQTSLIEDKQTVADTKQTLENTRSKLEQSRHYYQQKLTELSSGQGINSESLKRELRQFVDADLSSYYQTKQAELQDNYQAMFEDLITQELPDITRRTVRNATSTTISISGDEIGKVIGRDGVNIKAFERYSGVDLVIDDQNNTVTISSFDPKRRLIAKQALIELLDDGRVNRESIYDAIQTIQDRYHIESLQLLETGLSDLEINSDALSGEIKDHLAQLYYRHSYGQNQLEHSLEVAEIAGRLAKRIQPELNSDAVLAGLLHDIGKTSLETTDHITAGIDIVRRNNLSPDVITAISEHHTDGASTLLSAILQTADTLSSGRPGARSQSTGTYLEWLESVEKFIKSYPTVDNAFVVSGGKEVHILIKNGPGDTADLQQLATNLSHDLKDADLIHSPIVIKLIQENTVTKKVA